ncbi:hypothetical protein HJG60_010920 [Phyllostomus discolor]|uniref:CS domain-containing protein n=1 Tax=Phyllostomus discolor TaxID=89673 RepID=A0A834EAA9_9CHIR|nr:hypothetical protein HJG60_010920 [Phyllostomus discolor]
MMYKITVKELIVTSFLGIIVMLFLMQRNLLNLIQIIPLLCRGKGYVNTIKKKNYAAALETFTEGQKLDSADADFVAWIKRCQEAGNESQSNMSVSQRTHQSKIKYDWYQTEFQEIITLMIKNVQKNDVNVEFSEKELSALVKLPSGEDYSLELRLPHPIIPEQSTFKVLSTKIEIKMKKPEAVRWEKLEGQGDVPKAK